MMSTLKQKIANALVSVGSRFFKQDELRNAWRKTIDPQIALHHPMERLAYRGFRMARRSGALDDLARSYMAAQPVVAHQHGGRTEFDHHFLNLRINRVYDLPDVVVDPKRPPTINVLVPAFEFRSISAGFFGVFQVARFLRTTGMNVRLVLFDNFYFDIAEFKQKFRDYPGMENLLDELEIDYIGERKAPLAVSPHDTCMATVWYSAHFAKKIMGCLDNRPFIYLIQDYETNFFPGGSLFALADETYSFNYIALFSTSSLRDLFLQRDIGGIKSRKIPHTFFNNACSANLPAHDDFFRINSNKPKKKLVFYSRPVVDRNMFELTALALTNAFREGVFDSEEWDCIGMGLGEGTIQLLPEVSSVSLPRMNLAEYLEAVSGFDVCLTLMASPHPSLIPMDLAGSGAIVVTNTFATKTPEFLHAISPNIIAAPPTMPDLVEALRQAKRRADDLEARYKGALAMTYPRDWHQSLTPAHTAFFHKHLKLTVSLQN